MFRNSHWLAKGNIPKAERVAVVTSIQSPDLKREGAKAKARAREGEKILLGNGPSPSMRWSAGIAANMGTGLSNARTDGSLATTAGEAMDAVRKGRPTGETLAVTAKAMVDGATVVKDKSVKIGDAVHHQVPQCALQSLKCPPLIELWKSRMIRQMSPHQRQKKASRKARPQQTFPRMLWSASWSVVAKVVSVVERSTRSMWRSMAYLTLS